MIDKKPSMGFVPVGQQLDEQLKLIYAQVTRNSAMDLKTLLFVASNFRTDPNKVKEVYNRSYAGLDKGLTRPQFMGVMRQALGRAEGGDCDGMVDRAINISRTFNILDAPSGGSALDELRASKARIFRASPRVPPSGPGPAGTAPITDGMPIGGAGGITARSPMNSTRIPPGGFGGLFLGDVGSVPNTPLGDETSRFARGFVTPRRVQQGAQSQSKNLAGSASFMPAYTNISLSAHRPKTSGGPGDGSIRKYSLMSAALASPRPMTGTIRPSTGTIGGGGGGGGGGGAGSDAVSKLRWLVREERLTRLDFQSLFEHYDVGSTGKVPVKAAVSVLAELGLRREEGEVVAVAQSCDAITSEGSVHYGKFIAALVPVLKSDRGAGGLGVFGKGGIATSSPLRTGKLSSAVFTATRGGHGVGLGASGVPSSPRVPHDRMLPERVRTPMMVVRRFVIVARDSVSKLEAELNSADSAGQGTVDREAFIQVLSKRGVDSQHATTLAKHFGRASDDGSVDYREFTSFLEMGKVNGKMPQVFANGVPPATGSPRKSARLGSGTAGGAQNDGWMGGGGSSGVPTKSADPALRKRQILAGISKKVRSIVDKPAQLRRAFEVYDPKFTGLLTIERIDEALGAFGLCLDDEEAKVLIGELQNAAKSPNLDYTRLIGMLFPFNAPQSGATSSVASSTRFMAGLSTAQILKHLRDHVQRALSMGPEELRRSFHLFRLSGKEAIDVPQIRALLTDFALTVTDQQARDLVKHLGGLGGSVPYGKLVEGILPDDFILKESINSGISIGSSLLHRTKGALSDTEFKEAFVARLRRQLMRNGSQGKPVGLQLREALRGIESKWETVTPTEVRRALVSVGVVVPDDEMERLMKVYRLSGQTRGMNLTRLVEDVDPSAYDFVFTSGIVSSASMQLIRKEVDCLEDDTDPMIRNRLRQALRSRQSKDGVVNLIKELHEYDTDRNGCIKKADFVAAMLHLGLKVHSKTNLNRLWSAVVGDAPTVEIMALANTLTRQDEHIRKLTKAEKQKHVPFTFG